MQTLPLPRVSILFRPRRLGSFVCAFYQSTGIDKETDPQENPIGGAAGHCPRVHNAYAVKRLAS